MYKHIELDGLSKAEKVKKNYCTAVCRVFSIMYFNDLASGRISRVKKVWKKKHQIFNRPLF